MDKNVVDFESKKQSQLFKRKQAKVDALRRAFRLARAELDSETPHCKRTQRRKSRKE